MVATPTPRPTQPGGSQARPAPKPVKASLERLYRGVAAGLRVFAATDRRTLRDE